MRRAAHGSYNSAEAKPTALPATSPEPPAMRTRPSGNRVAVKPLRSDAIDPADVNDPVAGSYSSAVLVS